MMFSSDGSDVAKDLTDQRGGGKEGKYGGRALLPDTAAP
jgi:hypothetical protein